MAVLKDTTLEDATITGEAEFFDATVRLDSDSPQHIILKTDGNTLQIRNENDAAFGDVEANFFIGDGSQLVNLPPTGSELQSYELSEDLNVGDPIEIFDDNGVTKVRKVENQIDYSNTTSSAKTDLGGFDDTHVAYLRSDLAVASVLEGGDITVKALSVSPTGITVDSTVDTNYFGTAQESRITRLSGNTFALLVPQSNELSLWIGEVSPGGVVSLGSRQTVPNGKTHGDVQLLSSDKILVTYQKQITGGGQPRDGAAARVATVTGTSVSFGSETEIADVSDADNFCLTRLTDTKAVVVYSDSDFGQFGVGRVLDVSGTSVSSGSGFVAVSEQINDNYYRLDADRISDTEFVVSYAKEDTGGQFSGQSRIGTVSGTSISYGAESQFASTTDNVYTVACASVGNRRFIVNFTTNPSSGQNKGNLITGEVSGSTITYGTPNEYESSFNLADYLDIDSNGSVVVSVVETSGSGADAFRSTFGGTDNRDKFIGFMREAGLENETKKAAVVFQIANGFSGLVPGQKYFLDDSINLTTTDTGFPVGIAITEDRLMITKKNVGQ